MNKFSLVVKFPTTDAVQTAGSDNSFLVNNGMTDPGIKNNRMT